MDYIRDELLNYWYNTKVVHVLKFGPKRPKKKILTRQPIIIIVNWLRTIDKEQTILRVTRTNTPFTLVFNINENNNLFYSIEFFRCLFCKWKHELWNFNEFYSITVINKFSLTEILFNKLVFLSENFVEMFTKFFKFFSEDCFHNSNEWIGSEYDSMIIYEKHSETEDRSAANNTSWWYNVCFAIDGKTTSAWSIYSGANTRMCTHESSVVVVEHCAAVTNNESAHWTCSNDDGDVVVSYNKLSGRSGWLQLICR